MISTALRQLPARRGTLEQIYGVMEEKFGAQLNTELEAGPRQVPVWKVIYIYINQFIYIYRYIDI